MPDDDRVKRPHLDRRQPLRGWSTLFGAPPDSPDGDETVARPAGVDDVVARSVEQGYRVIDDWIRQGQRAAQRVGDGQYGSAAFTQDVQDLSARIAQHASDLFGVWLELFERAAAGGAQRSAAERNGDGAQPAASPPAPVGVRIEVTSTLPTAVALDLRPDAAGRRLVTHALRAADPDAPRLDDVSVVRDGEDGPFVARLRVPDGHPPGTYNGLVLDEETSRPVGTLSVRIIPPA